VCHRGASALAPENSLRAFQLALDYGADMSELDVHLSRDGELVVTHDAELHLADGSRVDVADLAAAELAELELSDGGRVPRLRDVFELVETGGMGIYVELKGDGTAQALAALLEAGVGDGVPLIAGSAVPHLVAELRAAAPDLPRSILFRPGPGVDEMAAACHDLGARYAHPCFRPITAALVDGLHAAGLQVMSPHSNDPAELAEFGRCAVDVVASDDPRLLPAARSRRPGGDG
jgi:glycerophosphoryl diester phosphodiesterase